MAGWESLPLLPLGCVLNQLPLKDCLAAMAACRHWRNAVLIFGANKEHITLHSKKPERNMFLARMFRKNVQRVTVTIEGWTSDEIQHLFHCVLPAFYDTVSLKKLTFIGPSYLQQNPSLPAIKLKRIITESLILKNTHCITKLAFYGCEMDVAHQDDRYMHDQIEYYASGLSFPGAPLLEADRILSRTTAAHLYFSTLQQISLDYYQLSPESLHTLYQLPNLQLLSACIRNSPARDINPLPWDRAPESLSVAITIIELPVARLDAVIENVLVEGLQLVALKVLFCKTFYVPLITHVVRNYQSSLLELVWADAPCDSIQPCDRLIACPPTAQMDACINPLILLCWQCANLRRLVIHGYWIWHYDVLGFVRLRKSLMQLEISAIYYRESHFGALRINPDSAVRVLATDVPCRVHADYTQQVNELTESAWAPTAWSALHPALRPRGSATDRAAYTIQELQHSMETM